MELHPPDTMSSYRSWSNNNNNNTVNPPAEGSEQPPNSNPFGNMRKERNRSSGMSYSDWKQSENKKKQEAEKNRPLTDDDFPPLGAPPGSKVVVKTSMNTTTAHDSITLAERLRNTIKRQEDEALRRRLELEEEEKKAKEEVVSLSLGASTLRYRAKEIRLRRRELEAQEEEENYEWQVSSEMEAPMQ